MSFRKAYDDREIEKIVWIPGTTNPADALTKPLAGQSSAYYDVVMNEGIIPFDIDNEKQIGHAKDEEELQS